MQEARILSLVQKDPTCRRAAKPMHYNCWACALQQEKPPQQEACTLQLEGSPHTPQLGKVLISDKDLAQPKVNK